MGDLPPFVPPRWLRGPHVQTIAGAYLPGGRFPYRARRHRVLLDDGDQVVLHDDRPAAWQPGHRAAMLIHGLGGSFASGYMVRIAAKLAARGVRCFRLDLRGCGAGFHLARRPYHSGCSNDAAAALRAIDRHCPGSPVTLIGFSMGGNITLKLLGELGERACGGLDSGVAVCPPIDLVTCSKRLGQRENRVYDRRFVAMLLKQLRRRQAAVPEAVGLPRGRVPRTLVELDDVFTAPVSGFRGADEYYLRASSAQFIPAIRRPTLLLTSRDDPLIAWEPFERVRRPAGVALHIAEHGGHLGFIARRGADPDRRWMDWRVVDFVLAQCARGGWLGSREPVHSHRRANSTSDSSSGLASTWPAASQ